MRIKEEFKRSGNFWIPSAPDRRVPGTLSISDGGNIELKVSGPFSGDPRELDDTELLNDDSQPIERIVGDIERDGFITLDDCRCIGQGFSMRGAKSKTFNATRAFTGITYNENERPLFNTLIFSIEGIAEWVGISGIEHNLPSEESIWYQQPEDILLSLGNSMQLLITFDLGGVQYVSLREALVTQEIDFKLVSQDVRELDEFISVVHKIRTFLCFVTDTAGSLDSMSATSDNIHQTVLGRTKAIQIYYPSQLYTKDKPNISDYGLLFTFKEKQNDAERIINNWLDDYEKLTDAFDLYVSAKMEARQHLESRFLKLVQGLEVYHRRTSNEKQMDEAEFNELVNNLIAQCPEERREWLETQLRYGNEVSLRSRLKKIIEPFKEVIGNEEKRSGLINSIVITRNYLTHYDPSLESKAAKGADLSTLCHKMELLFQLHFLQLIGFSREEIDSIVANCRSLQWKLKQP